MLMKTGVMLLQNLVVSQDLVL